MDELNRAYRELTSMISSERDARRADVKDVRGDIDGIRAHLASIDRRLADADERTSTFEEALLDSLGTMHETILKHAAAHDALEKRVADLEQWRRDQAS